MHAVWIIAALLLFGVFRGTAAVAVCYWQGDLDIRKQQVLD
jgi:hypothetical protein